MTGRTANGLPQGSPSPEQGVLAMVELLSELISRACRVIAGALLLAIATVMFVGVFWRYVLGDPLSWYEEVAKFLMVWMTFIVVPAALHRGQHPNADIPAMLLPGAARWIAAGILLVLVALLAYLSWWAYLFALNARGQVALTVGNISLFWIFLSVPVGFALAVIVGANRLLRMLADRPLAELREPTVLE